MILFMGGGTHAGKAGMYGGGGHAWRGCGRGDMHHKGGVCVVGGACVAGETATAADGTHPTGMHSCFSKERELAVLC